jgi:serine/threonine protein phosphatase PrpC
MEMTNSAVQRLGQLVSPETGIGTTVSCGLFRAGRVWLAHVGDSRGYLLRDGKLSPVTEDHTVATEARRNNASSDYLLLHPHSAHTLTRCVGQPTPLDTDLAEHTLEAGDRWLFATDGVTRMVPDEELAELIGRAEEPDKILEAMIALALERGGTDNATAVLVIVDEAA